MLVRRCALIPLLAALVASASGCAAVMAARQPGKKDLAVLAAGTPRTHVIAEFGPPVWTDLRGGQSTDIFAFKQGYTKPVKAARALLHGAADVATFGLWEVVGIPVETLADGADMQLEVHYDAEDRVASVSTIKGRNALAGHEDKIRVADRPERSQAAVGPVRGAHNTAP
jgi:hypothetical protein